MLIAEPNLQSQSENAPHSPPNHTSPDPSIMALTNDMQKQLSDIKGEKLSFYNK